MNTHQAAYEEALESFGRRMAERETRLILAVAGMVALAVAIIGALLAFLAFMLGNVSAPLPVIIQAPAAVQTSGGSETATAIPETLRERPERPEPEKRPGEP